MILINGTALNVTKFPDNTSQVWKLDLDAMKWCGAQVMWSFSHEGEFMYLAQLKALLDKYNVASSLTIEYLPYGRQDKDISNDSTFALNVFAKLLNSLQFISVTIHDPHSNVALVAIKNSIAIYPVSAVSYILGRYGYDSICYPDAGAYIKYKNLYDFHHAFGTKTRDSSTGDITNYEIPYDYAKGRKILIVDDICDGGATFRLLAKALLDSGALEVGLFVTHGLFTKGLKSLFDSGIKRIFTLKGEATEIQNQIAYRRFDE